MILTKRSRLVAYSVIVLLALLVLWPGLIDHLFSTDGFTPFAQALDKQPGLLVLFSLGNILIAVSFLVLAAILIYLMFRTRLDGPFDWIFLAFAAFLIGGALVHLINLVTLWLPVYWLAGYVRLATGVAAIATAFAFPLASPRIVAIIAASNEAEAHKDKLAKANAELEALYSQQVEIDRIKSNFFAGISHELRTPLTLLLGPMRHLLNDSTLSAQQRSILMVAERNGLLLQQYVDDLLDVSRLQTGQSSLSYATADLAVRFRIIASYFEVVAEQRKITFTLDTPPSLPVEIDGEKVEQIILNLLHHAFKFAPIEGQIRCSLSTRADLAVITVQDNGPQVKPGLSEISYERVEQAAPYDGSSSGLGLAIAREFTLLHGGTFTLTNTPDGPCFEATFPQTAPAGVRVHLNQKFDLQDMMWQRIASLIAESGREEPVTEIAPVESDQPLILVVEDNEDMNRFISMALALDYRVATAADGQEGLEKALELKPDLIITDLMMPRMGGEELLKQLQTYAETTLIPVILLTARTERDLRVRLLREGAKDYLVKPFSVDELLARVDNLIVQKRAQDTLQEAIISQGEDVALLSDEIRTRRQELATALSDLQVSQSRFRRLFEANIIGIAIVKHPNRLVTEANDAFLSVLGYSREDLSQGEVVLQDRTPPEYAEADASAYAESVQSSAATPWTKEYLRKDGSRVPVMVGFAMLDGQPDVSIGFAIDLTERRRAEESQHFLTDASSVLAASLDTTTTLENLCALIVPRYADRCVVDLLNNEGHIARVAAKDIDPDKQAIPCLVEERKPDAPMESRGIRRTLETGESQFYPQISESELPLYTQDENHLSELRTIGMTSEIIVPLVVRGRTLGTLTLMHTTSGRRYSSADLALMEDLARRTALAVDNARLYAESQQAIHLRDEFLSVAAHELKTPITSLRGFAQVTLRYLNKNNSLEPERARHAFQTIDQQSDKLARLVTQLLSISRIQAGRLTIDKEQTDLAHLVEGVAASAQVRTTKHTIQLHAPATLSMLGDPLRLEQVVSNLVDNAIKYSPDGGPIDIEVMQADDQLARLVITDHGIGIAPEHRSKIFTRFYQAQKRTYLEGMGLGLYISHEIVELHRGTIWAEFPSEGGTRFIVELPIG